MLGTIVALELAGSQPVVRAFCLWVGEQGRYGKVPLALRAGPSLEVLVGDPGQPPSHISPKCVQEALPEPICCYNAIRGRGNERCDSRAVILQKWSHH